MTITNFRKYNSEGKKVKAFFAIQTSEGILIKNFKLVEGSNGFFVSNPSSKNKNGEWWDDVTLPDQLKDELTSLAISEYGGSQPSNAAEGPGF